MPILLRLHWGDRREHASLRTRLPTPEVIWLIFRKTIGFLFRSGFKLDDRVRQMGLGPLSRVALGN